VLLEKALGMNMLITLTLVENMYVGIYESNIINQYFLDFFFREKKFFKMEVREENFSRNCWNQKFV